MKIRGSFLLRCNKNLTMVVLKKFCCFYPGGKERVSLSLCRNLSMLFSCFYKAKKI